MRQSEIDISSEHAETEAYWEEHWSDVVLAVCVLIYNRFIYL
jgi:hypothetical protein